MYETANIPDDPSDKDKGNRINGTALFGVPLSEHFKNICGTMLDIVYDMVNPVQASIMLMNQDVLEVVAVRGPQHAILGARMEKSDGIAWNVLKGGMPLHFFGVFSGRADPYARPNCSTVVPIRSHRHSMGTLNLNRNDRGFNEDELNQGIALGAAVAKLVYFKAYLEATLGLQFSLQDMVLPMTKMLSPSGFSHSARVAEISRSLARLVDLERDLEIITQAARLRDACGLLLQSAMSGSREKYVKLREASIVLSAQMFLDAGLDPRACECIHYSAERWDGRGPLRVAGENIPLLSQIIHVADALATYENAGNMTLAIEKVAAQSGTAFSPTIVRELRRMSV